MSHFSYAQLLRAHIFSQKCLNRTFSIIITLLTFYLFDDIEKKYRNHSCESFCYAKVNFGKSARLHVQSERLYFICVLRLALSMVIVVTEKTQKIIILFKWTPFFRSLKSVTLLLFEEMLVLTSY